MHETVIGLAKTNSAYVCIAVCVCALIWRCYRHPIQYGMVSSPSSCVVQIHYNGDGDAALIFVCRTGGVLVLNKQAVSFYLLLAVCALELESVSGFRYSMRS